MPRTISPFASPDLRSSRDLLSESLLAHHQHAFQPRRAMSDSWALWKGPSDWGKELGESRPEDGDISSPLSTRDFSRTLTMLGIETPDDFDFGGGPCGEIDDSSGPKGVRAARAPIFRGRIGRVVMAEMVGGLGNWGWVWVPGAVGSGWVGSFSLRLFGFRSIDVPLAAAQPHSWRGLRSFTRAMRPLPRSRPTRQYRPTSTYMLRRCAMGSPCMYLRRTSPRSPH